MIILIRENSEFILYARAVARTAAMNDSREKRRVFEAFAQSVMNLLVSVENITGLLLALALDLGFDRQEGETLRIRIAELQKKRGGVHSRYVYSRRRAGLHPVCPDTKTFELLGQTVRGLFSDAAADQLLATDKKLSSKEGSGSQNNRLRIKNRPGFSTNSDNF